MRRFHLNSGGSTNLPAQTNRLEQKRFLLFGLKENGAPTGLTLVVQLKSMKGLPFAVYFFARP